MKEERDEHPIVQIPDEYLISVGGGQNVASEPDG